MNTTELRKLNKKDLEDRLAKKSEELGNMQFEVKIGRDNDYAEIKYLKKEVARINTVLAEGTYSKEEKSEKTEKKEVKVEKESKSKK
jgi:ribosomal protein L29